MRNFLKKRDTSTGKTAFLGLTPSQERRLSAASIFLDCGLVILLGLLAGKATVQYLAGPAQFPVPSLAQAAGSIASVPRTDYTQLQHHDPFYRVMTAQVPGETHAPETSLEIDIYGLRAFGDGSGVAILKIQGEDQKTLSVGDYLRAGVKVSGVFADRIEITRGGVREAVYLIKDKALRPAQATRPQTTRADTPAAASSTGSRAMIKATETALKSLDLTLFKRDGRSVGFLVGDGAMPGALALSGLATGDILKSVNGERLNTSERLQELAQELDGAARLSLLYERRGQDMTTTVDLESTKELKQ
ncbi:hypothetical protein GCM10017044_09550 [Kordiimonas sediminis]|uniref:Type II secretion system protein GspC N-terminal domain-containing protein n=1 Tax=Kordiimonas sediminis TaxID=1735581 RepID=A0A919AMQ1_9PROT|nr:type II secretion system protein N [Kordiimonas sediminis]GHF17270.1 hypothetical protein GCM10017044_09550 [Kordiimonas sediminis]